MIENAVEMKEPETVVVGFGNKKIRKHGEYTRVIALDKKILENCGCDPDTEIMAKVELIKRPDEDFIKITPFCENKTDNKNGESKDE